MTEQLRQAFERAQQLPEHVQNYLAQRLLEAIEEREWEQIVSKPHTRAAVRTLAEEAFREYQLGETEEGGFAIE